MFHNVLYYLHMDRIFFGMDLIYKPPFSMNLPKLCVAEDIYAIADRLLLDDLKIKAFNFLKFTCAPENITSRALSKFAMLYKEVGDIYAAFYRDNWKRVRSTKEHEIFFTENGLEGDTNELIKLMKRYREVMEDAAWRL